MVSGSLEPTESRHGITSDLTRTADFILEFRQFFVIALATQALALYHFRPVPAPIGCSAVAHRALFIRQHDLLDSVTRLTDIRALNDFTDFPPNVCVVTMLAFFVYARFFLPTVTTTRRRRRQSRPTRVMRFRHATRDASSENNETTTTTTKKKKKRKEFLQREREERRRGRRMCYTFRCSKRKKETCQSF